MTVNTKLESRLLLFLFFLVLVYLTLFILSGGLTFPLYKDEAHYWQTVLSFSHSLIPDWQTLKSYNEPNTPLPFLIFGYLEYFFHSGVFAGRLLNLVLSFLMVCLIFTQTRGKDKYPILAACGLLLFPYYLALSYHLYTDIIATFFVLLGFWFYTRNHHILSAIFFILAIASRQTTLAFPLAITVFEFISWLKSDFQRSSIRWLAPLIACASIFGWIWFFGGIVPQPAMIQSNMPTRITQEPLEVSWLFPERALYLLACVGCYFVIPEWILFANWKQRLSKMKPNIIFSSLPQLLNWRSLLTRKNVCITVILLLLFVAFPPLDSNGKLIIAVNLLPFAFLQLATLYVLALLPCLRFPSINIAFWLIIMNAGILMRGYAWDKYALPLIVVLWYLKSIHALDRNAIRFPNRSKITVDNSSLIT